MTRKHFKLIAETIANLPESMRGVVAREFADMLAGTNPRFNRGRFLEACNGRIIPDSLDYSEYASQAPTGAKKEVWYRVLSDQKEMVV